MIVIFPADKLLLMTYGASAIPRISPRPTLDCLREPKVPIVFPAHFEKKATTVSTNPTANHITYESEYPNLQPSEELSEYEDEFESESTLQLQSEHPMILSASSIQDNWTPQSNTLSYNSLSAIPEHLPSSSSIKTTKSENAQERITSDHLQGISSGYDFQQEYFTQISVNSPNSGHYTLRSTTGFTEDFGISSYNPKTMDSKRSRSPSIIIEPASSTQITDPTLPVYGSGWGRPMSPMDLPPERKSSPSSSHSRSLLRPKLHIPRLGRGSSSDRKESSRLKEDLHLHVENPIFNSENVRQRNFDAFFESGEPVYKLHPTSASPVHDGTTLDVSCSPSTVDKYSKPYDSMPRGQHGNTGGLFAKSASEQKSPKSILKTPSSPGEVNENRSGTSQKGDRFLGKIFKWSTKS